MLNFKGIAVINEGVLDLRQWPAEQINVQRAFQVGVESDDRVVFWGPNIRLLVTAQQANFLFSRLQTALETGVDTLAGGVPGQYPGDVGETATSTMAGQVGIPVSSIPRNIANAIAAKGLANLTLGDATNLRNYLNGVINHAQKRRTSMAGSDAQPAQQQLAGVS